MANLKDIDEKALIEGIERQAKYGREAIERAAEEAIAAVKDAKAGLSGLPDTALALFTEATAFYTAEAEFGETRGGDNQLWLQRSNGQSVMLGDGKPLYVPEASHYVEGRAPNRYRVFVAFLPLKAK